MTNEMTGDWAEQDRVARDALESVFDGFGGSPKYPNLGMFEMNLNGTLVGKVSVNRESDWLVSTINIGLVDEYRFDQDVYAAGEYQPRYSMLLMQALFDQFAGSEIREGNGPNSDAGDRFLARVRGEYGLPYHLPSCFEPSSEGPCMCDFGRTRGRKE